MKKYFGYFNLGNTIFGIRIFKILFKVNLKPCNKGTSKNYFSIKNIDNIFSN